MKIPYGMSDFGRIREEGFFYADKTRFIPVLEDGYQYLVFLRPRRFGKSTLVSMLEHYYDVGRKGRFDALFISWASSVAKAHTRATCSTRTCAPNTATCSASARPRGRTWPIEGPRWRPS